MVLPAVESQRDVVQSVLNAQGCVGDERRQRRYVLLVAVKSHELVVQSLFEAQAPPNPTGWQTGVARPRLHLPVTQSLFEAHTPFAEFARQVRYVELVGTVSHALVVQSAFTWQWSLADDLLQTPWLHWLVLQSVGYTQG